MYFEKEPGFLQREKIALAEAQNWRCCYCKFEMLLVFGETDLQAAATREHLVPRMWRGKDTDDNLVIACRLCNELRNHINPFHFEKIVTGLLEKPEIHAAWHHFTPYQFKLLGQEVKFAVLAHKIDQEDSPSSWQEYKLALQRRQALLANL